MLNPIIRFSLRNRLAILTVALFIMVYGSVVTTQLPVDVLPDLTRPRVVLITEAPGLAPEEVEALVTLPLEASLSGASGIQAVRSSSDIGLSVIYAEFDWSAEIMRARQVVQERIAGVLRELPDGVHPEMAPVSSLLGQIMLVGVWSEAEGFDPLELRTLADWVIRKRLLTIPGVSQVITMGGGKKQYQVLVNPHLLHKYEVSLEEVEQALLRGNYNVTGGYLNDMSRELLVRGVGRAESVADIEQIVVKPLFERSILIRDVAEVQLGAQVKRGDSAVNGEPAVVITIQKQPGFDTRELTTQIRQALQEIERSLPAGVQLAITYQQRDFIDYSIENVIEAVRDGAILVVIVLTLFLFNFRTTFITLTAIPLSVLTTALVFRWFDLSINVMTLGGISVALGELVDDAIVDVENIFHRLKQNARREQPLPILKVVFDASFEVRGAILMSTVLVVLVFLPLFALTGMEGRLFTPLGIAYIVSIVASTVVSLTVTPVLSSLLLPRAKATQSGKDGPVLRLLKAFARPVIRFSMSIPGMVFAIGGLLLGVLLGGLTIWMIGKDFLPEFDEGAVQVNLYLQPGTSLETSTQVARMADERLLKLLKSDENPNGPIQWFTGRTGRAENDEHVMGVNVTEYILTLNPESGYSRSELIELIDEELSHIAGAELEIEQPIAHLISHMLSGVTAQIAIKVFGDDLDELRRQARMIEQTISDIPGIAEPVIEQQTIIPQLRIDIKREQLAAYGLSVDDVNHLIETAMNGRTVSQILEGQRAFDLIVRYDEEFRHDVTSLDRLPIELADGRVIPLSEVAHVYEGGGPNTINREDSRRRIVIRVNTRGRDLASVVHEIQARIADEITLPAGYFVVYGGQFEAQQSASQRILLLSLLAGIGVFVVLYMTFPSTSLVLQILTALPAAFIGGVLAIVITQQTFSIASMVGFISLGGIAARNGILLIGTYLQKLPEAGFTREMITEGSLDRLAPVLMTALTTGLGLVPLVIGGHLPGKEILFPVATVVLGGLVTSTAAEFLLRPGLYWYFGHRGSEYVREARTRQGAMENQESVGRS